MLKLITAIAVIAVGTLPALAEHDTYCPAIIETLFTDQLVPRCEPGDVLQLQIAPTVGPSAIVARLCDMTHTVWTEASPAGHVNLVCIYKPKQSRAQLDE